MPYRRKQYKGAAVQTTITGALTSSTPATIGIAANTGWPSGATPFVITIDPNTATEETALVTLSGSTLTFVERGYDDTAAVAHDSGAVVIHSFDAASMDQVNRLANLQAAKGDLLGHNGTNPTAIEPAFAGDGSDDGKVIKSKNSEATGYEIDYPDVVTSQASAPDADSSTPYGLWGDETQYLLRWLDSGAFVLPNQLLTYASLAALTAAVPSPRNGYCAQIGDTAVVRYDATAAQWKVVGVPEFANDTARDAFYTTLGLYDGAKAKHVDDYSEWEYRQDEWIRRNAKITTNASAPSNPHDGDIWFQPVT